MNTKYNTEKRVKNQFDLAKKVLEGGSLSEGYFIGGRMLKAYMTNSEWEKFKAAMAPEHMDQFGGGLGDEMSEYSNEAGKKLPPKMSSYGSSSRFIYNLAKDIEGFKFEEKLCTGLEGYDADENGKPLAKGKHPAHLDGYLKSKSVYVEAKCHEFYYYFKPYFAKGHKTLFDDLKTSLSGLFDYSIGEDGRVSFSWDGVDTGTYDLKQMLCHLSGIANKVLRGDEKKVNFIYLVYKPEDKLLDLIPDEADRTAVADAYRHEIDTASRIDFSVIYEAVLRHFNKVYGRSEAEIKELAGNYSFTICSQEDFCETIKQL